MQLPNVLWWKIVLQECLIHHPSSYNRRKGKQRMNKTWPFVSNSCLGSLLHWRSSIIKYCPPSEVSIEGRLTSKVVFYQRSSSIKSHLPSKAVGTVCHQKAPSIKGCPSSIEGYLKLKVLFKWRSSSIKGCLPLKDAFRQSLSSIKGPLPSKFLLHQKWSSIKSRLLSKAIFYQKPSSIKSCLPSKVVFHQSKVIFHERSSSIKGCLPS